MAEWADRQSPKLLILPAVLIILAFSIFPLVMSLYLSVSRFKLVKGGFSLKFVGFRNYEKLLFGSKQFHLLGTFGELSLIEWALLAALAGGIIRWFYKYFTGPKWSVVGVIGRLITSATVFGLVLLAMVVLNGKGLPGSLMVTVFYVFAGVAIQFSIGLGLAVLCAQRIHGRNFFRLVFFIPLMVTPVGIAYAFRMLADTHLGPFAPLWGMAGLGDFSWVESAWSARWVVLIGDSWQWIPFMFMVLLAALENQPTEQVEAAKIDGANGWQIFRDITWPAIAPVAATVVLIRLIEAFKIVDLPNVLTNGGPGIATESLTLHSFIAWRTQDLGGSAAVGYMLLFVSCVLCVSFFNFIAQKTREHEK